MKLSSSPTSKKKKGSSRGVRSRRLPRSTVVGAQRSGARRTGQARLRGFRSGTATQKLYRFNLPHAACSSWPPALPHAVYVRRGGLRLSFQTHSSSLPLPPFGACLPAFKVGQVLEPQLSAADRARHRPRPARDNGAKSARTAGKTIPVVLGAFRKFGAHPNMQNPAAVGRGVL
jgi:hypothetical protein